MSKPVSSPLKIIFAGTPAFAAVALDALIQSPHQIIAVYTQPDKPAGRGLKLMPGPVKVLAEAHQLPVYQPASLKDSHEQTILKNLNADVMVVAAYGMLLPEAVLAIPTYGCINIHPSLLPRWRGAAPIQRAIFAGDQITGVTIMQMDKGLDTGPILLQHAYALAEDETSQSLHDQLAKMGAQSLLETLKLLSAQQLKPIPQDNALAVYADKITKEEARLNWSTPARELEYHVRAFNPWPVAHTRWQAEPLRVWMAKAMATSDQAAPGTLMAASRAGIDIATQQGILRLLQVQLPGGKPLSATDFYNAKHALLIPGKLFS